MKQSDEWKKEQRERLGLRIRSLREAAGRVKRPAPSRISPAKPMAMIWVALKCSRRFFIARFSSFLWSNIAIPFWKS